MDGKESSLISTLRSENLAEAQLNASVFIRVKIEAFSQNVGKVFQSQIWYQRTLFSVYAGTN